MAKARKRLDRLAFWKRVAFFVVVYVLVVVLARTISIAFAAIDVALIIWFAVILARRFRDIGWPAWIGPSALLVTLLGLGLIAGIYNVVHPDAFAQYVRLLQTLRIIAGAAFVALVLVAGCVPGRPPESQEIAGVFD